MKTMHPRKRLLKIIGEAEQLIRDVEWWNTHRTDAEPLDCESDRIVLSMARRCLKMWDAGERHDESGAVRELISYAKLNWN